MLHSEGLLRVKQGHVSEVYLSSRCIPSSWQGSHEFSMYTGMQPTLGNVIYIFVSKMMGNQKPSPLVLLHLGGAQKCTPRTSHVLKSSPHTASIMDPVLTKVLW